MFPSVWGLQKKHKIKHRSGDLLNPLIPMGSTQGQAAKPACSHLVNQRLWFFHASHWRGIHGNYMGGAIKGIPSGNLT